MKPGLSGSAAIAALVSVAGTSLAIAAPDFNQLDVDRDGQITRDEAKQERPLFLHFDAFDKDVTNGISPGEYENYRKK